MKILIAEDGYLYRNVLKSLLQDWGHENIYIAEDGEVAWDIIQKEDIDLAIIDWIMPKLEGIDLIKKIRLIRNKHYIYTIILTSKETIEDLVEGLKSGADDYITKPFNNAELKARLNVGIRQVELRCELTDKIDELERALKENGVLRGLLPICSSCKKIRDDDGYWGEVDNYLTNVQGAKLTHSICPDCKIKLYPDLFKNKKK